MSELIAEARVLVTPDTTTFRPLLIAQVNAATQGVAGTVPVTPVFTPTQGAGTVAGASRDVADAADKEKRAVAGATDSKVKATAVNERYTRSLGGLSSGAASSALSLVGLRGATLAATGPFLAGAAGAIAFSKAIGTATNLQQQLSVFAATTGATAEQMERVSQASRDLGRDISLPGVTAGQAAETMTEFAKAGLDVEDAIAATRGGLQLATAAQLSYVDAVQLSANALNAFNLQGNQAVHVADVLANAANLAQGGIGDTALALRQAAGAAAVVGVSFEDTAALLTLLARNGLTGSDAGTALRTAFLRLVNPSKEARNILESLNVELRDLDGNVRPEVFAEFANAQRNLTAAQQQANAAIVFGQDAFRAFGFLGREGAEGLREVQTGLQQTGTASRIANARMVGLTKETANLKNQLDALGIVVGETVLPVITPLVGQFAEMVGFATDAAIAVKGLGEELEDAFGDIPGGDSFFDVVIDPLQKVAKFSPSTPLGIKNLVGLIRGDMDDAVDEMDKGGENLRQSIVEAIRKGEQASFGFSRIGDVIEQQMASAASKLTLDLSIAQAQGNQPEELSLLRTREQRQEDFLNALLRRDQTPKNVALATKAAQNLDATRAQIATIVEGQQSAARAAADKVVQAANAADQTVLQGLATARQNQENAVARAANTASVSDDIRETAQLRALVIRQIEQTRARVQDAKTEQAAVQALVAAKIALTGSLERLRQTEQDERDARRQAIFDRREENAALRTQIAEARGNRSAIIRALDAEILIAKQAFDRARAAGKDILRTQLKWEELKRKKRELLKDMEDDLGEGGGGTTAFDLLTQAAERFGVAGNIIGASQPFAGPTEFTADLSQFLRRNTTATTSTSTSRSSAVSGFQGAADRLVEAINRNTDALNGGEGGPTKRRGTRTPVSGAILRNDQRWVNSSRQREEVHARGG